MHDDTWGLIIPSSLYLRDDGEPRHLHYDPSLDEVRARIVAMAQGSAVPALRISGNLPLGWGFASSSILTFLYAAAMNIGDPQQIAQQVDSQVHRFPSSGMDSSFCLRQRPGYFRKGIWKDAPGDIMLDCSIALFPKERQRSLAEVRKALLSRRIALDSLARELSEQHLSESVRFDRLFEYATELSRLGTYGELAATFIERTLAQGIIAKGIGGLYDKAVLVVWRPGDRTASEAAIQASALAGGGCWLATG